MRCGFSTWGLTYQISGQYHGSRRNTPEMSQSVSPTLTTYSSGASALRGMLLPVATVISGDPFRPLRRQRFGRIIPSRDGKPTAASLGRELLRRVSTPGANSFGADIKFNSDLTLAASLQRLHE